MDEEKKKKKLIDWTTREELLLACAVERYGSGDWKTVAMEIKARTSLPIILLSAEACKSKFHDLKRRFMDDGDEKQDGVVVSWLEELRKLRVLELKEEVRQSDLSIQRLQLKVKRLEDEKRDTCLKVSGDHNVNLDLTETSPEETESPSQKSSAAADGLDRNHRHSVNESNSSDYIGDSSATIGQHAGKKRRSSQDEKRVNSAELSNQTAELKLRKTASNKRVPDDDKDHPNRVSPATSGDGMPEIRSQPLVELLDVIRSHKQIRLLERRPEIQNTAAVRQYIDLENISSSITDGSYSINVNKFYRDLLLFFTNATVSFPKTSPESAVSHKLRDLVLNHLNDNRPSALPPPPPASAKKESSAPVLVVCRRRSSVLAKPNKPSPVLINDNQEKKEVSNAISSSDQIKDEKIKSATPATTKAKNNKPQVNKMNTTGDENSQEKKKRLSNDDRKKKGVVEFLKRIVSKSPPEKPPKGRRKKEVKEQEEKKKKSGKISPDRIVTGKRKRGKEEVPLRITKKPTKKRLTDTKTVKL